MLDKKITILQMYYTYVCTYYQFIYIDFSTLILDNFRFRINVFQSEFRRFSKKCGKSFTKLDFFKK